jgi:NADH-quinone oxidoreductase subunit C
VVAGTKAEQAMKKEDSNNPRGVEDIQAWRRASTDYNKTGITASYIVDADKLLPSVKVLKDAGYFLEDIAGVDVREGIMLVYHFDRYDRAGRIAIRLIVPHERKEAPSIISIFSGANWHERECLDFFGVHFEGNPDMKPLLLPDDLGLHPLLKSQASQRESIYNLLPLDMVTDHDD